MRWHKACSDCVLSNYDCLLQDNDEVEDCDEVDNYEYEGGNFSDKMIKEKVEKLSE